MGKNFGTFGSNAELSAEMTVAYMKGFQGEGLSDQSVMTMVKHFPGGGPQLDGLDPTLNRAKARCIPAITSIITSRLSSLPLRTTCVLSCPTTASQRVKPMRMSRWPITATS